MQSNVSWMNKIIKALHQGILSLWSYAEVRKKHTPFIYDPTEELSPEARNSTSHGV